MNRGNQFSAVSRDLLLNFLYCLGAAVRRRAPGAASTATGRPRGRPVFDCHRPGKRIADPSAWRQHPFMLGLPLTRYRRLAGLPMTDEEKVEVREAVAEAFRQGCVEARAGVSADLRNVITISTRRCADCGRRSASWPSCQRHRCSTRTTGGCNECPLQ